jgi:hypothetical protein
MTSFATPAQLASRMQSDVDTASAQLALDNACGLIRAISRQQFDFVSQETITLTGSGQILVLPQRPAVVDTGANPLTVVELGDFGAINFTLVESRDFVRVGNELTRGYPFWANTSRLMGWPLRRPIGIWAPRIQVTYSHGYTTIPDDVVGMCLDIAQSIYSNPDGLRSVSIDDYTEVRATELLGAAAVESIKVRLGAMTRRRGSFSIVNT